MEDRDAFEYAWKPHTPKLQVQSNFGQPPKEANKFLSMLGKPHVDSFNMMLTEGLRKAILDIPPVEFALGKDDDAKRIKLSFSNADILSPRVSALEENVVNPLRYPKECRIRGLSYKGRLSATIEWSVDGQKQLALTRDLGEVPIMVKSEGCNLYPCTPKQLVEKGEHEQEWGGYFIIKGHERLLRMLSATRKNYPMTVQRETWKRRGKLFTDMGVFIRCVKKEDFTSTNNVLHYLSNGTVKLMCSNRKALHFIPLVMMLRALVSYPDSYIYDQLTQGLDEDLYYKDRVSLMLRQLQQEGLYSKEQVRVFLGKNFRVKFPELPNWFTDEEVCAYLLRRCVAIHLERDEDKFDLLVFMTRKLYAFAQGKCALEGMDPVMMQEVTLGGHLYLQLLKDRMANWLSGLKYTILKMQRMSKTPFNLSPGELGSAITRCSKLDNIFENFLATGNVPATADLGLMQASGLSIVVENINRMRYMSHFRAIHRGAAFMDSRSSEVRQLKPDAWGFLCPVHTPDGAPCGLLNHLTATCQVVNDPCWNAQKIADELVALGMIPFKERLAKGVPAYEVMLEGCMIGRIRDSDASRFVDKLRILKVRNLKFPRTLEIAFVPRIANGQYPGIFLFIAPGRMMRPVYNEAARDVELIGTFEQVYLNICVTDEERYEGMTTHRELSETAFLSNLASLIPLPDFNQSPRNMYQCQMGKQTMGSPIHNWRYNTDNKLYRLQTPTTPLLRPGHWDRIDMDDFAMGTNAIVAVISYTGYDMEDAMVINRASLQRGFAHGQVYKTEYIDLKEICKSSPVVTFKRDPTQSSRLDKFLDADGLPYLGILLTKGTPYYCYYIEETNVYHVMTYKGQEAVYVDNVRICGSDNSMGKGFVKVCITIRIPRNPQIGDKFASRAGQKGICSQQWLSEDMPFTESGLVPDIVFNPHGFPSRMTIAMMIECMAGKSGSVHGLVHDATPFRFSEDETAIEYHGKLLEKAGYNYYGTEKMYSGIDGREMEADIFFGVVHYQRLRHMVSDKFQVRSVGTMDVLTRQPVKGRARGGGVRFGEMERDGLVSHGAPYLLFDRLFTCSDKSSMEVCRDCGTFLPPLIQVPSRGIRGGVYSRSAKVVHKCNVCPDGGHIEEIMAPYVYKYLVAELASVNLRVSMKPASV